MATEPLAVLRIGIRTYTLYYLTADELHAVLDSEWLAARWRLTKTPTWHLGENTVHLMSANGLPGALTFTVLRLPSSVGVLTPPPPVRRKPDLDGATARLVYSSVPAYRNSDRCPKPDCGRVGYFKQMALCCDVHGAFHG